MMVMAFDSKCRLYHPCRRFEDDFPVLKAAFSTSSLPDIVRSCYKPEPHVICQIARALACTTASGLEGDQGVAMQLLRLTESVEMYVLFICSCYLRTPLIPSVVVVVFTLFQATSTHILMQLTTTFAVQI
jgi:hypothetical protein